MLLCEGVEIDWNKNVLQFMRNRNALAGNTAQPPTHTGALEEEKPRSRRD
jgi:hypothetical protein